MSIISQIVARLEDQCADTFRIFGLAGDLAALKDKAPLAAPAVYVFVKSEASEGNPNFMAVRQLTQIDIGLMLITRNIADAKGGAAAEDIEALKDAVRAALVGYEPEGCHTPIENIGGELVNASSGTVWWEHTIGVSFLLGA